jgi:hypothetical protein
MRFLCLLISIVSLLSVALSSPVVPEAVLRIPLVNQHNSSSEKEQGWIDPRLNGGSFLDVSVCVHNKPITNAEDACHLSLPLDVKAEILENL